MKLSFRWEQRRQAGLVTWLAYFLRRFMLDQEAGQFQSTTAGLISKINNAPDSGLVVMPGSASPILRQLACHTEIGNGFVPEIVKSGHTDHAQRAIMFATLCIVPSSK